MPYINIRIGSSLNNTQRESLYKQTTELMAHVMKKQPKVTVVNIQELDPQLWAVNGTQLMPNDPVAAYVDIKVTEGTNSSEEKAEMLSRTTAMLMDVLGTLQEACYIVIDDLPANSWGYDGLSQGERVISTA